MSIGLKSSSKSIDAVLRGDVLPGIGRPEAAGAHQADAGDARLQLVELAGELDELVVGRHRLRHVDRAAEHLLDHRLAQVDHPEVAVERDAVEAGVGDLAVVEQVGVVEVVERQAPLRRILVERREEARGGEVAEPGREELQRVEGGVAGDELGHRLVIEAVVRDRHQLDLDAGELLERLQAGSGRFRIGRADGEAHRLACLCPAHRLPVHGADPVELGIPERLARHVEELLIVLADVFLHRDRVEHRLRIGQAVLRVGGRGEPADAAGDPERRGGPEERTPNSSFAVIW